MKKKTTLLASLIITLTIVFNFSTMADNPPEEKEKWVAPKSADQMVNPFVNDVKATKEGKKLFQQMCTICHGNSGKGDGMAGAALNPKPTNFTLDETQKQTDGALFWKITEGRTPMAAYKDVLTETKRWQLVNYIRTMK